MRKALILSVKIAVSGLLLYFTLGAVNIGAVTNRLGHIDARWVALGLFFLVVQLAVLTWRWQLLVARCGADLPFSRLFRLSMIGVFFNQTLPSSAGGDAMRIWLLGKQSTWRIAAYSVLLDRVTGVVALAVLVVLCLPWTLGLVRNPVGRAALLLIGCGCIVAGIAFVGLSWRRLQFLQRWSPTRHLAAAAGIALSILRSPSSLIAVFGSSIIVHLLTAFAAWCAARAVGCGPAAALFFVLGVAGRLADRHPDFNCRLGRSRRRNGRRIRLCGAGPKRRLDCFLAVRIWIFCCLALPAGWFGC